MPLPYLIERFVAEYLANQGSSRPMKITHSRDLLATAPACTLAALGLIITAIPAGAAETTPNILFILVGNLGYGELGVYGGGATRDAPAPPSTSFPARRSAIAEALSASGYSAVLHGRWHLGSYDDRLIFAVTAA